MTITEPLIDVSLRCACELRPDDVLMDRGYPVSVIEIERTCSGLVHIVFGVDPDDQAFVSPDTCYTVARPC
ncbi:MAG TPA: hypothetical protein VIJ52_08180 [Pseudolabrys sp.]